VHPDFASRLVPILSVLVQNGMGAVIAFEVTFANRGLDLGLIQAGRL
jgi:hypothetical protein